MKIVLDDKFKVLDNESIEFLEQIADNPVAGSLILKLSNREFEVFCAVAVGEAPQQTAARMGLSVKTISTYRQRLMEKLQLDSNQHVAVLAHEYRITRVEA